MEMNLRAIRTESEYDAALEVVAALMDVAPGTSQGARFDVLVTLIEDYESRHWAITESE